jgi:IclR family acetate operon transcriptional repressor
MAERAAPAVESVDRALRVLEALAEHGGGIALDKLAKSTGIPKSSLHRTLATLRRRGFATQQPDGRYLLGVELLRLAFSFHERLDVRAVAHPLLERLRDEVNETVHLGILDGRDVVYLDKLECSHSIRLTSMVGGRNPAHCTAVGKALLAFTYPTDREIRGWARRHKPLERRTPSTITTETALAREMGRIRRDGYAQDLEESEPGVHCVAAPLFLGHPVPRAAVSVSAPRDRLPPVRILDVIPLLSEVTRVLGPHPIGLRARPRARNPRASA